MKREERYDRKYAVKKNQYQAYFDINPIITMNSPFDKIVEQVRRTKKSKEWKDHEE